MFRAPRYQTLLAVPFAVGLLITSGCIPERVDNSANITGEPLKALMQQIGSTVETLDLPKGGEGRVISEFKKLWHYLHVSSKTSLVFLRSRYTSFFTEKETVLARFENEAFGTIDINAQVENSDDSGPSVHVGYIKFTAIVINPSPGTARAEIYPFPREYNGELMPPSLQMVLPPSFVVPSNSHIDHRKRYLKDEKAMDGLQKFIQAVYAVGRREVVLPD